MSFRLNNNSAIEIMVNAKPLKVYVDGFTSFFLLTTLLKEMPA